MNSKEELYDNLMKVVNAPNIRSYCIEHGKKNSNDSKYYDINGNGWSISYIDFEREKHLSGLLNGKVIFHEYCNGPNSSLNKIRETLKDEINRTFKRSSLKEEIIRLSGRNK